MEEENNITVRQLPPGTPQQAAIAELLNKWYSENGFSDDAFDERCQWALATFAVYLAEHFDEYKQLKSKSEESFRVFREKYP